MFPSAFLASTRKIDDSERTGSIEVEVEGVAGQQRF